MQEQEEAKGTLLIVLYGPPGVGKLTVAKELSKITGYRVMHNHLTLDLVTSILGSGANGSFGMVDRYRLDMVKEAAKNRISGLILTSVYGNTEGDDRFANRLVKTMKRYSGSAVFVQLICSEKELRSRIHGKSRKRYNKIKDEKTLYKLINKYDLFSPIKSVNSYSIENTDLSASEVAKRIKSHYGLWR
jgi:shikimate kinase